jgi:hypothetical protein
MRYSDIKIVEKETLKLVTYQSGDLFEVIISVDNTDKLFKLQNVPFDFLKKGKDPVYKKLKGHIEKTAKNIKKPFEIKTVTVIDKNGKEMPLQDLFPSNDGDKDALKYQSITIADPDEVLPPTPEVRKAIQEYIEWRDDPSKTKFKKDERATVNLSKEQISKLIVKKTGKDAGALLDPNTKKAIGAIANTPFADRLDKILNSQPYNLPGMLGIVDVAGAEGEDGDEGLTGEQAGSAGSIAEEIYKAIKGPGTDETRLFRALERIETEAHLKRVGIEYEKKYDGANVFLDIKADFDYDISSNQYQVDEMNRIMAKFGLVLLGTRIFNFDGKFGYEWMPVEDIRINKKPSILLTEKGFHWAIGFMAKGRKYATQRYDTGKYKVGIHYVPLKNKEIASAAPPIGKDKMAAISEFNAGSIKQVGELRDAWLITLLDDAYEDLLREKGGDLRLAKLKEGDPVTDTVYSQIMSLGKNGVKMLNLLHLGDGKYMPITKEVADYLNSYRKKS